MSRIRWYHFYVVLAAFDVILIVLSLEVHRRTVLNVRQLAEADMRLYDQSQWLQTARQNLFELHAPGNDLFRTRDVAGERQRFELACSRIDATLGEASRHAMNSRELVGHVNHMKSAANEVFDQFESWQAEKTESRSEEGPARAGRSMALLDDAQRAAGRSLDQMAIPNASARVDLLQQHENDLESRLNYERYFIAAIIVILAGVLHSGRRLQQADRALTAARQRVQDERRERLAAIGELCSSVAHGIRNPLASIRSSAQLALEMGQLDAESRDRLRDILSEGRRLADRVTRLLGFAKTNLESFETLVLQELVASAVRELKPELDRRGVNTRTLFPAATTYVQGDRHQLQQVVIELVSNAMEHARSGGSIMVSCGPRNGDGTAILSVEDDGPGVPPESRERIFDLFYTTKPTGTGIGLATVRRIARTHGGDVVLENPTTGGARFIVSLPTASGRRGRSKGSGTLTGPV